MSTILLNTKIHIPAVRSAQVLRPRLFERLNAGLRGKLTLVSAPAGFGKTIMVSSWIRETEIPTAWLSLDKDDNDPIRFWTYFVTALQTIEKDIGSDFLAVLSTAKSPPFETLLTDLINEIEANQTHFVFVLDDYHVIDNGQIQEILLFLLDHLPLRMHLVLISRADPPWPLARLRASRKMTELRAENLRFSHPEAAAFLNEGMGLMISPEDVDALEKRTEGWIVGLQMAALSMQKRSDISTFIRAFTGTHRFILDYLLEEVLEQQTPRIQDFLLKTSILDRMTGPLCDSLLESDDGHTALIQLEQANLFLVPLDDERSWYRYHHLFTELLRNQLALTQPRQIPILHCRASEWYEDQGLPEEAITHAFSSEDFERVASLVEKFALNMLHQSKYSTLFSWIEAIPGELVSNRPWLCVYQAWTRHWSGMREGGDACLENAERALNESEELSEEEVKTLPGYIAMVRAHYALINEKISLAIEQAEKALRLLPEDHFARGTAAIALGGAYWGLGDVSNAERAFAACASYALKGGYYYRASSALCYVGMQQVKQARLFQAEKTFREALSLAQGSGDRRFPTSGYPLAKLGELACEWNNLEEAHRDVTDGVNLCTQLGHVDLLAEAYAALARVLLARRDFSGVVDALQQTDRLARETKFDPWAVTWLEDCRLRLWLATGRQDEAFRWVEISGLNVDAPFNYQHDLHHLNLARVLVARSMLEPRVMSFEIILRFLDRLLYAAQTAGWVHHNIQILILKALAYQEYKDEDNALNAIRQALRLAEASGYVRIFIDEGEPMGGLLSKSLAANKRNYRSSDRDFPVGYIKKLLATLKTEAGGQSIEGQSELIEPLTPREMEVLHLLTTNMNVPEISEQLFVTANTVRSHVKHIYEKLAVNRRLEAVQKAKELNLV